MFSCSRHLGLPETHQEHNETSADASTEPSAIHPQETSTEKRTQPRLRPDASTPVAAPPQLSERMIGQRQQDCTAGAPTVQGRERAPDARTQPMREHHGGLRTHNTEQWGGGEGEAGPPYLSMGGWNSPVSQVIWVDHGGDIWVRDILNVAALGHPYQLIPKGAPPDRSPTALGWGTHQRIKDISHRAALCIGMLRSTMMRNTMITVNMIPITYHNDHTPTGNGRPRTMSTRGRITI